MHLGLLLIGAYLTSPAQAAKPKNAILLSDVQSLTLRADRKTTHRRVPAIPQLRCVSPRPICDLHAVDLMRCVNQGASYDEGDVQWACTASLPPELKLGATEVICEGYASPEDPYVLKGSCGVEYRLVLTERGEERYPHLGGGGKSGADVWGAYLFGAIFVAVLAWIVWAACFADQRRGGEGAAGGGRRPGNDFWGGGGGGGGGGGWWPGGGGGGGGGGRPPYDDPPPPYPGTKPSGSGPAAGGWQPGFWSGLAGGAAAGYFAGRSGRNDNNNNNRRGYDAGYGRPGYGSGGYGGPWGGGGGPSTSRPSSGSSSSSTSSARYESTGFGSTNRR